MSSGLTAHGLTLEQIFAPFTSGTQAAATGINGGGSDLNAQFAPLSAGSAAATTGINAPSGDLNVYFAALGTTSAMPGVQGLIMSTAVQLPSGSGSATSTFTCGSSGWIFTGAAVGGVQTLSNLPFAASGLYTAVPAGATQVQVTATLASGVAGSLTNTLASVTPISTGGAVQIVSSGSGGSGFVSNYQLVIKFYNASSVLISTTTCNLVASCGP